MKKLIALLMSLVLALSLAACGGKGKKGTDSGKPADGETDDGQIKVEEGLLDVTITMPADFVGEDITQESLDEGVDENRYKSATINEDGSVTYVMTKAQHDAMLKELQDTMDEALDSMAENYENMASVKAENDYTKFIVTLNTGEMGLEESFAAFGFTIISGYYHMFKGEETPEIVVDYIDGTTGELIDSWNSSELDNSDEE